jgi:hypothetical protein
VSRYPLIYMAVTGRSHTAKFTNFLSDPGNKQKNGLNIEKLGSKSKRL